VQAALDNDDGGDGGDDCYDFVSHCDKWVNVISELLRADEEATSVQAVATEAYEDGVVPAEVIRSCVFRAVGNVMSEHTSA